MNSIKCPCCDNLRTKLIGRAPIAKTYNGTKSKIIEKINSNLYKCRNCKLLFKSPKIKNIDALELYNNSNVDQYIIPLRSDHQEIIKIISKTRPKSVLDFGCYTGDLLTTIDRNIIKYGIEINAAAAELAAQKSRGTIFNSLDNLTTKVDCIVLCDVIEHLDNPASTLLSLNDYLNNKGIIIVTTGNSDHWYSRIIGSRWYYSSNAEHISFINPDWLKWLCRNNNYLNNEKIKHFRYKNNSLAEKLYCMAKSLAYLAFPNAYTKIQCSRRNEYAIPGLSAWKDHMLIVLKKTK